MKHTIKKMKFILYFCLAMFLLYSCTEEKEYLENNNRDLKFEQKPFKDLILLKDFNNAYQKVKSEKQKNIASRSALENEYNFTIVEGKPINIVEIDNRKYYNILIEREVKSEIFFENLLFEVIKENNIDQISAYIIKYQINTLTVNSDVSIYDKELTNLFGRFSGDCFNVCDLMCYDFGEGGHAHPFNPSNGCDGDNLGLECHEHCLSGGGGGNGTFGGVGSTGNGSVSTGGGGVPIDNGTTETSTPTNQNGATSNGELSLVLAPVSEVETPIDLKKKPCEELVKMTNNTNIKNTYTGPNGLNNAVGQSVEYGFAFSQGPTGINSATPVPNSITSPNVLDYKNFVGGNFYGGSHTHHSASDGNFQMFSTDDFNLLFSFARKSTMSPKDYSVYVFTLTVNGDPVQTYAIKIEDFTKLFAFIKSGKKYEKAMDSYYRQNSKLSSASDSEKLTKNFLKMLEDNDTGVGMYQASPDFSNWSKLSLNPLDKINPGSINPIVKIPCK